MNVPPRSSALDNPDTERTASLSELESSMYETRERRLDFARPVAKNGYLWWYVDAISENGDQAMTMIVFVGSVFSPYYARARKHSPQSAEQHCAFNTILYGPGSRKRWSMTERDSSALTRTQDCYRLGPSEICWDGESLLARIDEWCVPWPRRMQGQIRITPSAITPHTLLLDIHGRHRWHPIAPIAKVEVDFPGLGVCWTGEGYLDCNEGSEPLSDGFYGWDWARVRMSEDVCTVRYETRPKANQPRRLSLSFDSEGRISQAPASDARTLRATDVWRVARTVPSSADCDDCLERTLEDTPFYARSLIRSASDGRHGQGIHESLSMDRFEKRWVQTLLPFRMPRIS
ncbi:MAG: carotenoid 1,2-hydratase [Pseudomonadota bacterium]